MVLDEHLTTALSASIIGEWWGGYFYNGNNMMREIYLFHFKDFDSIMRG